MSRRKLVTLLVPARNEEGNLPRVFDEVTAVFAGLPYDYEVLILDNASTDETPRLAREFCRRDGRWRYLRLSRDFSVEGSLAAGLQAAQGDAALILFSDLQDPTNRIPDFLARWEQGYEVVYGVLETRTDEPIWKSWGAHAIYRFLGKFASVEIPPNATDFRLLSRRAIDVLNQCPERLRYLRGLSHWIGFRSYALQYKRRPRVAGSSKASLQVMFHLAGNALTGFSLAPLRAFTLVGLVVATVTVLLSFLTIFARVAGWSVGLTLTEILLLTQLAATFLCAGVLGEYVGRAYWETKQRPLFAIEDTCNLQSASSNTEPAGKSPLALLETFPGYGELRNRRDTQEHCHAA
jgi:polyisoprenyl-phosphate glycosyltransferase